MLDICILLYYICNMSNIPLKTEHIEDECSICLCVNRKWVEADFINWLSPDDVCGRHPGVRREDFFPHFHTTGLINQKFNDKRKMCLAVINRGLELMDQLAEKAPAEVVKLLPKMIQLTAELDGEIKRGINVNSETHYHMTEQKRDERLKAGLEKFGGRLAGNLDN